MITIQTNKTCSYDIEYKQDCHEAECERVARNFGEVEDGY